MTLKRQKAIAFIPAANIIITWIMAFRTARRKNIPSLERFKMCLITVALLAVIGAAGLKLLQLIPAGTAATGARLAFNYLLTVLFSWAAIFAQKKFGACDESLGNKAKSEAGASSYGSEADLSAAAAGFGMSASESAGSMATAPDASTASDAGKPVSSAASGNQSAGALYPVRVQWVTAVIPFVNVIALFALIINLAGLGTETKSVLKTALKADAVVVAFALVYAIADAVASATLLPGIISAAGFYIVPLLIDCVLIIDGKRLAAQQQ